MDTIGHVAIGVVLTIIILVWSSRKAKPVRLVHNLEQYRELLGERAATVSGLVNGRIDTEDANERLDRLDNQIREAYRKLSDWEKHIADSEEGEEWKRL